MILLAAPVCPAADPIESGRDALGDHWNLNWYDAETDDYRPLNLPPQKPSDWSFFEWFFDLFSGWSFDFSTLLRVLAWLAVIGAILWVAIAIIRAQQQAELASADVVEQDDGRSHIERVEALPVAVERRVTDLLAEARRLHAAGDASLAIVYLYSHQLVTLDKRGLLRLVKGKTNRQYLRELRRNAPQEPRLGAIMEQTVLLFERAFFGAHPPTTEGLEACLAASDELEAIAARVWEKT